ncbi:hypothetical protein [Actinomadura sp. NEAU-AAG7]|uniref:hypothetical protein n=1 Tax=Actinomadura sp. NEAU-AAG7 TaxID=2839640 RepID=UPI001BE3DD10|nr:hypothetical protein [Actinomadura sp. NEAU-AAG7]MBT2207371.1 hypothetical protein [Actinomadura sp. NEAU-AAG7]
MPESTRVLWTIDLDDPLSTAPDRAGAEAAGLARAAQHRLPVLPGFVIPAQCVALDGRAPCEDAAPRTRPYVNTHDLREAWARLSHDGARPLVLRPSPAREDGADPSSAMEARDWSAFIKAAMAVAASAESGTAVLVQPRLDAEVAGVVLGADPVSGRTDRTVVSAVPGDSRYTLTRRGHVINVDRGGDTPAAGAPLTPSRLRTLARMAARAASVLGGPQEIEFAFDRDGRPWLLHSRRLPADLGECATGPECCTLQATSSAFRRMRRGRLHLPRPGHLSAR